MAKERQPRSVVSILFCSYLKVPREYPIIPSSRMCFCNFEDLRRCAGRSENEKAVPWVDPGGFSFLSDRAKRPKAKCYSTAMHICEAAIWPEQLLCQRQAPQSEQVGSGTTAQ
jgi:hypothetical protein